MISISPERQRVIDEVRTAFAGVVLGNGIGLHQGQAIDDYEDEATQLARREKDEKTDWSVFSAETLDLCHSSLSFFDAEGMRFHLPAFIIADLRGESGIDPVFHLSQLTEYKTNQFALLSLAQRQAIRSYLILIKGEPQYDFERPHIESALASYWID